MKTLSYCSKVEKTFKSKKRKRKFMLIFLITTMVFVSIIAYIAFVVNPIIISIGEAKVRSLATKAVNSAVGEVLFDKYTYDDIISIKTDSNGDISHISANSLVINKLSRDLASTSQTKLDVIGEQGISIPLGTLLGIPIMHGRGPDIRLKLNPIGSIICTFNSYFTQAGINQTNHKIYVNITSNLTVVLPVSSKQVSNTTQILICESVIIGKVPDTYLHSDSLENMMDLIP